MKRQKLTHKMKIVFAGEDHFTTEKHSGVFCLEQSMLN